MGRTAAPEATDLTLADATARLGLSARHVLSLAIEGKVEPTIDGGLTAASVERYATQRARAIESNNLTKDKN